MVFKTCIALLKCTSMLFLKMKPKDTVEKKNKLPCTHFLYLHAGHTLCIGIKRKVALPSGFLCKSRVTVSLCSEAQGLISGRLDADSLGPFVADHSYFRVGQTFAEWDSNLYKGVHNKKRYPALSPAKDLWEQCEAKAVFFLYSKRTNKIFLGGSPYKFHCDILFISCLYSFSQSVRANVGGTTVSQFEDHPWQL